MLRNGWRGASLLVASILLAGCLPGGFNWMLEVQNGTDEAWYVRVPLNDRPDETLVRVAFVPARAHGPSVEWFGKPAKSIELLDEDCRLIGTFDEVQDGLSLAVPDVPGITGRIVPYRVSSPEEMGGIQLTDDCDGFLYL